MPRPRAVVFMFAATSTGALPENNATASRRGSLRLLLLRRGAYSSERKKPRHKAVAFVSEGSLSPSCKRKNHGARPWHSLIRRFARLHSLRHFFSTGSPSFCHSGKPPRRAPAFVTFFDLRLTTAPADVCSLGQEQYVMMVLSFGNSSR